MGDIKKLGRQNVEDILPLTPLQEGMLFYYLNEPESELYFEQISFRLDGNIKREAFLNAWSFVIKSNQILRTIYRWQGVDKPVQIILKEIDLPVREYDFSASEGEHQQKLLDELKEEDRKERIDIGDQPFRILLCKLQDNAYEMILSSYHILYDGWSNGIILKEFLEAYSSIYDGKEPVRKVKTGYKEFIKWIQEQDKNKQEKYWKENLSGFDSKTLLPVDHRKQKNALEDKNFIVELPEGMTDEIRKCAMGQNVTIATLLYTAWGILLQKYNNTGDVLFGTTISGRTPEVKGIEDVVGLFINTLPLRIKSDCDESVSDLLSRVEFMLRERAEFESTPLTVVRTASALDAKEELFDSIVVIENYPLDEAMSRKMTNLRIKLSSIFEMTNYDLTLVVSVMGSIGLRFIYDEKIFEDATIQKISDHLINIIKEMIENPKMKLSNIKMMSDEEIQQILFDFNNTQAEYPKGKTLYELFEEQVCKTPVKIAAVFEGESITYRELNAKANRLAEYLRENGVKKDSIVAVLVNRSLEMTISLWAILKAGGAYLPLSPDYPEERIRYILEDSQALMLLTQGQFLERVSYVNKVINVEDAAVYSGNEINLSRGSLPNDLAYVIYTSGSTGKPKGAMIEHYSVTNRLNWMQKMYPIGQNDVILQKTPYTFDVSVWELFWWSFIGAKVCFLTPGGEKDPKAIIDAIEKNQVTVMHFVPSMLSAFLDYLEVSDDVGRLGSLKSVFASGEALSVQQVEKFNRIFKEIGKAKLHNLYGPTEATVDVSYFNCSTGEKHEVIPIGKPIDNIQLYILGSNNSLQPVGVVGELCIAGDGLARGYLNKPELTAEKFVANPFEPGSKMYRTGDLAKWRADGNIEYLGRIDHQVKIRGFRIELGEIESALSSHFAVKNCVAVVNDIKRSGSNANEKQDEVKYICAYIVSDDELPVSDIRGHIAKILPDYMIPSYFVRIDRIPVTANGKIDKKALPDPMKIAKKDVEYIAPVSEIEEKLAEIWKNILGVERIGIHENFFDIGGNSILLIQLHAQIEKRYPGKVTMTDLFAYTTISSLAEVLSKDGKTECKESLKTPEKDEAFSKDISIIGMSAQMPSAENIEEFWNNLKNGVDCITTFPADRRADTDAYLRYLDPEKANVQYFEGAYLDEIDKFDYKFFRMSPNEASLISPNQRMFLENAWHAVENAGYGGNKLSGSKTGVYIGFGADVPHDYKRFISDMQPSFGSMAVTGNMSSIIASRIAYLLDLRGPCIAIDTACSSALVAVHEACRAIRGGECEMALVGSIKLNLLPIKGLLDFGINSSDGRARTFDESSDGTGTGEGVMAVLIKPLDKAIQDRDSIYAVIKGSSVNQDGRSIGITAPNVIAQEEVIVDAWKDAGIDPETISYIEAHGTGTKLGDPIEIDGISRAFRRYTDKKQFCAVGSVKTNIGHLDNAAGMAGLLKVALSLKNAQIPKSLHFNTPNKKINFDESPVYVAKSLNPWESEGVPKRCGVSSFGLSGTNCHVVMEEAPIYKEEKSGKDQMEVLTLSAKSEKALKELIKRYVIYMEKENITDLADVCYTANTGRWHYNLRLAITAESIYEMKQKLSLINMEGLFTDMENGIYYAESGVNVQDKQVKVTGENTDLSELCRLYIEGADIPWDSLYTANTMRKVHLPLYPFDRDRCWITPPAISKKKYAFGELAIDENTPLEILEEIQSSVKRWKTMLEENTKKEAAQSIKQVILKGREQEDYKEYEIALANVLGNVLGYDEISVEDSFDELGGDSINALDVISDLKEMKLSLEIRHILQHQVVKEVSKYIKPLKMEIDQGLVTGEISLLPVQKYFFEHIRTDVHYWDASMMIYRKECFDAEIIEKVFSEIVNHHDALRSVFALKDGQMYQYNRGLDGEIFKLDVIDLRGDEKYREKAQIEVQRVHSSLNLKNGPVIRLGLFKTDDGDHLLFVIHHLIFDSISMRIVLEDFIMGYLQAMEEKKITFAAKTNSFMQWSKNIYEYAFSEKLLKEADYWKEIEKVQIEPLILDNKVDQRRTMYRTGMSVSIPVEDTQKLLKQVNAAFKTQIDGILLTAFGIAMKEWTGRDKTVVRLASNGRDGLVGEIDVSRTVGWFSISYPFVIDMCIDCSEEQMDGMEYQIKSVRDSLTAVPEKGIGYDILRYITLPEKKEMEFKMEPEIFFNYLGQYSGESESDFFTSSDLAMCIPLGPNAENEYVFEVYISIVKGSLVANFYYDKREYEEENFRKIVNGFGENLSKIIHYCADRGEENGYKSGKWSDKKYIQV